MSFSKVGGAIKASRIAVSGAGQGGGEVLQFNKVISISGAGSTAEQDTGWDLPGDAMVNHVYALITTASSAGATLNVGILASESTGDADGFLAAVSAATTGTRVGTITSATSGTITACTIGAYLATFTTGSSDTLTNTGGIYYPKVYPTDGNLARSLSWTLNSSTDTSFRAKLVVEYTKIAV